MKLLVFAHTPPPHHGQSYMVQLMLAGLGGDRRKTPPTAPTEAGAPSADTGVLLDIECYHVNARLSRKLEDIGDFRIQKFLLLLGYCLQAIWCRFRYGVTTLYYIPAPGKCSALYRDWMVMLLCRPFFKRIILHWHAAGLGKWLETRVQIRTRALTYRLLKHVDLSIVLSQHNRADAEKLFSRQIKIVPNGIPDPCPNFASQILPRRKARLAAHQKLMAGQTLSPGDLVNTGADPQLFKVVYLAHCTRQKGLFDTLEGVALANAQLVRTNARFRFHLTVAGEFMSVAEQQEFKERIARPDLQLPPSFLPKENTPTALASAAIPSSGVTYKGFVLGEEKTRVLAEADCFCFPTYYYAESFGLVLLEAMAFGSPVIASRWRSIPELLPRDYCGLVEIRQPQQIARVLLALPGQDLGEELRAIFLRHFKLERHLAGLAAAFHSVEQAPAASTPELRPHPSFP